MTTAIILLNFNSFDDTQECVESLLRIYERNYKIIIVDNSSDDDSIKKLQIKYKNQTHVEFILSPQNLGFSGGCNLGIHQALKEGYEYILLLNNDTLVEPDFLTQLLRVANTEKKVGIVGGKTFFADDRSLIWDAGGFISEQSYRGIRRRNHDKGVNLEGEVGFITCCLALVKKEVFEKIGLLPDAYFFGSEEWEFSLRASRAGFKLMYTPTAIIYHKVGRSHDHASAKMLYNTYRNRILFVKRNYPKPIYVKFMYQFLFMKLLQRFLNKGQLKCFTISKTIKILRAVLKDSKQYDSVTKKHWAKIYF